MNYLLILGFLLKTIILIVFMGMIMFLLAWRFSIRRFDYDCMELRDLIKKSEVNLKNYDIISKAYSDLKPCNRAEVRKRKEIWFRWQIKFASVSPCHITVDEMLKARELNFMRNNIKK